MVQGDAGQNIANVTSFALGDEDAIGSVNSCASPTLRVENRSPQRSLPSRCG
jgi:hypothetical protein